MARAAHAALWRSGIGCDIVPPGADLAGYRLVVVPAVYLLSDEAAASLRGYAAGGGQLVVTFLSGVADQWHRIRTGGYPGALRDVLGIRVEEFHPLHPGTSAALTMAGTVLPRPVWTGQIWTERLRAEGAEVLAAYSAGPLAGLPAINHGTGPVTLRASGRDLITGREIAGPLDLPPDGVAVIREPPLHHL